MFDEPGKSGVVLRAGRMRGQGRGRNTKQNGAEPSALFRWFVVFEKGNSPIHMYGSVKVETEREDTTQDSRQLRI